VKENAISLQQFRELQKVKKRTKATILHTRVEQEKSYGSRRTVAIVLNRPDLADAQRRRLRGRKARQQAF
jgi:hypothetical protein